MRRFAPVLSSLVVATTLVVPFLMAPLQVRAASAFTVTRTDDPKPNGCQATDCSLREAVIAANGSPGSTVRLPGGTYTLTIPGADTSVTNAAVGDLDILAAMTITGAGSGSTIVQAGSASGNGIHRIFDVHSSKGVFISGMTIRHGTDTESKSGGCIKNSGVLTLDSVVVTLCTSSAGGAGISSYDSLTIRDSVISANELHSTDANATVSGGGIAGGPRPDKSPGTVTIIRTRITNNVAINGAGNIAYGGGFSNAATMTVRDSIISGNIANSSAGGISDPRFSDPDGTMRIERSTISGNKAHRDAGGVDNDGTMTVVSSTFSDNEAGYQCSGADCGHAYAGGLLNTKTGTLNVENSTFSGNRCLISGGGILNSSGGTLTVRSSTIVGNVCDLGAGMATTAGGTAYVANTIVANNDAGATGGDCSGTLQSEGYNIIRNTRGCAVAGDTTGNILGTDPRVGALQNNGGPTFTRALLADSPAVNAGDPSGCADTAGNPLTTDQRGFARSSGGRCDIGAYELQLGTSVVLWTTANRAMAWQLAGSSFVSSTGFGGPGPGWTAQSYWRNPDRSYQLLWSADNVAQLWKLRSNDTFVSARGLTGPGAGWTATSVFFPSDGGYELLWTADNAAQVWKIKADGGWGGALPLRGPGAGWKATSYYRASDGSRRVLWTSNNRASIWTLTVSGGWGGAQGMSGPGAGWTATSYSLKGDGTISVLWTAPDRLAAIWTMNANGTFKSQIGLGGPSGWSIQSYFFE